MIYAELHVLMRPYYIRKCLQNGTILSEDIGSVSEVNYFAIQRIGTLHPWGVPEGQATLWFCQRLGEFHFWQGAVAAGIPGGWAHLGSFGHLGGLQQCLPVRPQGTPSKIERCRMLSSLTRCNYFSSHLGFGIMQPRTQLLYKSALLNDYTNVF